MKFNIGDKVSFINEKQNGFVVKLLSHGKVVVEIEDGFEIEVFEKELVKIETKEFKQKNSAENIAVAPPAEKISDIMLLSEKGTVSLAAVPGAIGAVLTGSIEYYLLNATDYDLLFSFYIKEHNSWKGVAKGSLEKNSSVSLFKITREQLIDISVLLVNGLVYTESKLIGSGSFRKETGVIVPDLNSSHKDLKGTTAYGKTTTIFKEVAPLEEVDLKDLVEHYEKMENKKSVAHERKQTTKIHGVFLNEKEVDLHIEELVKDFSGLSNGEMVQIQLKHFYEEMDTALKNHFKRIIFIHGVGNGRLKQELRQALRSYPGIAFKDADHSKYGYGATEVIFV